jgi:large subunit ribosomal protein L10
MNRQEKEQIIESLKNGFQKSNASFLINYKGLSVAQMADLRKKLRQHGGSLRVAKVTLIKRAVDEVPAVEDLESLLGNQIALVFAKKEPPAVAKVLCDFAGEVEQLKVVGGSYESSLLTDEAVKMFAKLPSREVLLAQVCGTLQAPISKLAFIANALLKKPLVALKQVEKKKSSS